MNMRTNEFSFGRIDILRKDLAEFIIKDGIEVNMEHVDEAEEFLKSNLAAPFSLLFNKKNNYSFQFNAQVKMGNYQQLNAVAILCYTESSKMSTNALVKAIPRKVDWNAKIFFKRGEALNWFESQQENITKIKN